MMKTTSRNILLCIASLIVAGSACAQSAINYPARPVRLLIPFVPGGSTDFVARVMQSRLIEECSNFTRQQVKFWAKLVQQVGLAGKQ
jgi:tripartite-type tricarboxylate transporter receptor subunit TctC